MTPARRGRPFLRLVIGELRVLLSRTSRWWLLGVLALIVAGAVVPIMAAVTILLAVAWLWPVLIWSRVGTQQYEHDLDPIVASTPAPQRRLLAEWTACGARHRGGRDRSAGAPGGTRRQRGCGRLGGRRRVIPTLALGSLSRSPRTFQAAYLLLWIVVFTGERHLDFMGAVRVDGEPAGLAPVVVLGVAAALGATAFVVRFLRQARR